MTCYRVVRRKYADLSDQGARLYGDVSTLRVFLLCIRRKISP